MRNRRTHPIALVAGLLLSTGARARADDCLAPLHLLGPYLAVEDNGNCGGMNVRFTGIYVKSQR